MTVIEYIDNYVNTNFSKEVNDNREAIINYLKSGNNKISVRFKPFGIDDMMKVSQNGGFTEEDKLVDIKEDGITIRDINSDLVKLIVDNLPDNIKDLEIPKEVYDEIKINSLKNVESLALSGEIELNKEYLEKIKGLTNIKTIDVKFEVKDNSLNDEAIFSKGNYYYDRLNYKGIEIKTPNYIEDSNLSIRCANPYKNFDKLLLQSDFSKIASFEIEDINEKKERFDKTVKCIDYSDMSNEHRLTFERFENIAEIEHVLSKLEELNLPIDKLNIKLENKNYDDIAKLKSISDKYNTKLEYDNTEVSLYDFIAMRETLNYYTSLINEANLSPLEKVLYAYDLIKSFEYKEDEQKEVSRNIHSIIRDGKIVCVGYSVFLAQLLKEVGVDCINISAMVPDPDGVLHGHQRNIVKVTDEKYGIDGSYALDATWDSAKNLYGVITEEGEERIRRERSIKDTDTITKYYDNLSMYSYFLVPTADYQKVFVGEKMPDFKKDIDSNEKNIAEPIAKSFTSVKGLDRNKFIELVTNVRLKEGYSKEAALESIKGILEIQDYLKGPIKKKEQEEVVVKK